MSMTCLEEFKQQWNSLCNYLESEMIKSNRQNGAIDLDNIQRLLNNEKKRWKLPGQYNYAWLEKLRSKYPDVAREFEDVLTSVQLQPIQPSRQSSSAFIIAPGVAGAAIGFVITRLLDVSALVSVMGTAGLGVVGVVIGVSIYRSKSQDVGNEVRDAYMNQMKSAGRQLESIVKPVEME